MKTHTSGEVSQTLLLELRIFVVWCEAEGKRRERDEKKTHGK